MRTNSTVWVQPSSADAIRSTDYDLFVASVGYESRCTHAARILDVRARRRWACAFPDRHTAAFHRSFDWYSSHYFNITEADSDRLPAWIEDAIDESESASSSDVVRLCIDISSMSRRRIASWIEALRTRGARREYCVDFVYSLASFAGSPKSTDGSAIERVEPVLPSFAGCLTDPERPLVALIGLGFEPERALGAIEYVEPTDIWALWPEGGDEGFFDSIRVANETLWQSWERRAIHYSIQEAFRTFVLLESLSYGFLQEGRLLILPFGPKILTLGALLCACLHPELAVWRVSAGESEEARDVRASGELAALRVQFGECEVSEID